MVTFVEVENLKSFFKPECFQSQVLFIFQCNSNLLLLDKFTGLIQHVGCLSS